jgi:hypothetical protein
MLFAHGFGCDQTMWRYVWPCFAEDHRVVLFDHVGFGESNLSAWSPDRYAIELDQPRKLLSRDCSSPSMSSRVKPPMRGAPLRMGRPLAAARSPHARGVT